jgi:single-stranded DNA-specific DHH superfamily exonuclease
MKKSPLKHLILTHIDVDGMASMINVYNIIEDKANNFQYYAVGYHSIDKTLQNIKKETFDVLWILDLRITEAQLNVIKSYRNYKKIIWIDHHTYEYDVREAIGDMDCVFIHDETMSACQATNSFISYNWPQAWSKCKELCYIGDIYDMWRTENPRFDEAYALNDLFWEYRYEKFFQTFKNGYSLSDEDRNTIEAIHKERTEYEADTMANFSQENEEFKILYVLNPACKHINHITLAVPDKNFYVILKEVNDKNVGYSLRIYNLDFNLTLQEVFAIIKKVGITVNTSGGHERVGGINIPLDQNDKFLEAINAIFEGTLQ